MGFNRSVKPEDLIDFVEYTFGDWSPSLKPTNKIPRKVGHADGHDPLGPSQNKNPTQKRNRPNGIPVKAKKQPRINTRNNAAQRRPQEQPFNRSGSDERSGEGKRTKYPTPMNTVPKAKQRRHQPGRNRD